MERLKRRDLSYRNKVEQNKTDGKYKQP